jgi:hypothetical protein
MPWRLLFLGRLRLFPRLLKLVPVACSIIFFLWAFFSFSIPFKVFLSSLLNILSSSRIRAFVSSFYGIKGVKSFYSNLKFVIASFLTLLFGSTRILLIALSKITKPLSLSYSSADRNSVLILSLFNFRYSLIFYLRSFSFRMAIVPCLIILLMRAILRNGTSLPKLVSSIGSSSSSLSSSASVLSISLSSNAIL